jgi:uncharacterized protein with FMN-binding domain
MRKTIAILVVVALLGMLAVYELPPRAKKPATASVTSTQTQTTQNTAAAQSSGTSSSAAQASSSGLKDGTFTGTTETGFYDTIQVAITVSGGKITAVNTPVLSGDSGHSDSINSYAVPQLNQEVLSTQSAQIDGISGASYTTQTYTQSLQSAIDQAKA